MTVQDLSFLMICVASLCALRSTQATRKGKFALWFSTVFLLSTCVYLRSAYAADTKITDLSATVTAVSTQEFATNDSTTDRKITLGQIRTFVGGQSLFQLAADYTNSTTTGTEVGFSAMTISAAGTYHIDCRLLVQSAATTTSPKFGVNYTGTATQFSAHARFPSSGVTAAVGQIEDDVNATTGQVWAYAATVTETTTAPNLGPWTGVVTANANNLIHVEALMTVSDVGDIELWAGSEVAASAVTIKAGSFCMLTGI